ncbi:hypothetical protein UA08_01801 [Talaromyces atroroseus]|uniref:Uncharacterized protein n=1 Tax=Talaromyces atroroseus TaxID=1441469 RepID=A0A1Q5QBM9_TALAT|nr:hypothetical protein UA08_01801 [Talaromyces atroroseus]OKL63320.1 hypothetical protein UA08_01801 [Talaromyces atroroseus]
MAAADADPVNGGSSIQHAATHINSLANNIQLLPANVLFDICKMGSLRDFVQNCEDEQTIPQGHTHLACNAFVQFMQNALSSRIQTTQRLGYSHKTWLSVFEVVLTRLEEAALRPMKQVLATLTKILVNHPDIDEARLIFAGIKDAIMPSIILGDPKSRVKSSLACLERFVRDGISPLTLMSLVYDWLAAHYGKWRPLFAEQFQIVSTDISHFSSTNASYIDAGIDVKRSVAIIFNLALLMHAENQGHSQAVGTLMALLYTKSDNTEDKLLQSCYPLASWTLPTKYAMLQMMDTLDGKSKTLLSSLLGSDIRGFRAFIAELPLETVLSGDMKSERTIDEFLLLFSALRIGKEVGFVHEDTSPPSMPISAAALRSILAGLPSVYAESDSQFRQEVLSLIKQLMPRLRGAMTQKDFLEKEGKDAKIFMENYINFLEEELIPTASYQRHISALKSISVVVNSGVDPNATHVPQNEQVLWRYKIHVLRPSLFRLLVDLLLSSFDDIRGLALEIISLFPSQVPDLPEVKGSDIRERLITALSRAEALASRTSRADHADTVARLYHGLFSMADKVNGAVTGNSWFDTKIGVVDEILKRLEGKLFHDAGLFYTSPQDAPLHGHTSALRYIVATPAFHCTISNASDPNDPTWRRVHDRIIAVCERTWTSVKPVLCVDSPEGHTDELLDDFMVGPKDLLSYSWRALKDSSLLLHAIVSNTTYAPRDGGNGMLRADYEAIGTLSFVQLSQLRHRGAFSAVSQTFETCCVRCAESRDLEISSLPDMWYQESLKLIQDQASKLTRRSAGLPALVNGISIAKSGKPLFDKIMNELLETSNSPAAQAASYHELSLPQVHAMNCLRSILTNTKLASRTEPRVMPILRLAADCLSSPIWAIRNCGLMLFHALMNRMCKRTPGTRFGFSGASGTESNMTIPFQKYTGLTQLMAELLASADEARYSSNDEKGTLTSAETEKVFPALEILAEKIPSTVDDDDALLRDLVLVHVKSTIWAVRDHSARVYASLLRSDEILSSTNALLDGNVTRLSQIHIHGKLLCIRYALLRIWHSDYWRVITQTISFANEVLDTYGIEHSLAELVSTVPESLDRFNSMRAESLLRRSLTWCIILTNSLSLIVSEPESSPAKLIGPFFDLSTSDSDAACWILERVRVLCCGYEKQKNFLSLYLLILLQGFHEENIKANTALNLAEILEDALEKDVQVDFLSKWARVSDHLAIQSQESIWGRELAENVLRLQGSLLALKYMYAESTDLAKSAGELESIDLRRWAVTLRSALNEDTVYSARFSAIMSLKTFSRVLRKPDQSADTSLVSLELYMLLHDMLNDDDDELRSLSALIASRILSYSALFPNRTVALSSVPASESLTEFMAVTYSSQSSLFHHSIARLMGPSIRQKDRSRPDFIPFKTLFEGYCTESAVLFEVEKQNLFIDDVRECDNWTKVFKQLDRSIHDKDMISKLAKWASEGLGYLNDRMAPSPDRQEDNIMGWTSKPEVYALGALLFNVASLLIFISAESDMKIARTADNIIPTAALKEALNTLHERGRSIFLHPHWLNRVQAAISVREKDS